MSFVNAYLHFNWTTKDRLPLITRELKPLLLDHILENAKKKEIYIDRLNCVEDHIHLLISQGAEYSIKEIAQLIKGESSLWVNRQGIFNTKFGWQNDYYAVSVSPSAIARVRRYIDFQEEHHKKYSWEEEIQMIFKECGVNLEEHLKSISKKHLG